MAEYDNNNTGVIFKNNKKTNEKQPDYTGKATIDGKEKQIAVWLKDSKAGKKFFSLRFSDPYTGNQNAQPQQQKGNDIDFGGTPTEDIPF